MKRLVVATGNRGKLREIRVFLEGLVEEVLCTADFPDYPQTVEDGTTFKANALKKARDAVRHTGLPALADDSGLAVDALDGRPGVHSARFAGEGAGDAANNAKLLAELVGMPAEQRGGAFICALAFVTPSGDEQVYHGRIAGTILEAGRGSDGFGYDPLFLVDCFGRTMAELTVEEKNRISHRGQALAAFRLFLEEQRDRT